MCPICVPIDDPVIDDDGKPVEDKPAPAHSVLHRGSATPGQSASSGTGNVTAPNRAPRGQGSTGPSSSPSPGALVRTVSATTSPPTCAALVVFDLAELVAAMARGDK